jgi:hypothetical protein|eukprot:COSAG06_NODE_724_length_12795_cov_16.058129_11_plen_39_part_00
MLDDEHEIAAMMSDQTKQNRQSQVELSWWRSRKETDMP